jgi:hypothetical protein
MKANTPAALTLTMLTILAAAPEGIAVHGAVASALGAAPGADEPDADDADEPAKTKDGKPLVTVRGCLHGTTLGDVESDDEVKGLTASLALRTSREMRRRVKAFDRHHVELTGVLTPAPKSPLSGRWGGTTVTVGAADPRRSPAQQSQPAVASLEVESVESLGATCP